VPGGYVVHVWYCTNSESIFSYPLL
jgi:hypothetical protein